MVKRIYQIKRKQIREQIDLRDYEDCIIQAYREVAKDIKVVVKEKYYCVYGDITNGQLRRAGSYIATFSGMGSFCNRYGNSTQLFERTEITEI